MFHVSDERNLHKSVIRALALSSDANYKTFNGIMFPYILEAIKNKLQTPDCLNADFILLDAPTLYETHLDDILTFDKIILVYAEPEMRLRRIRERAQTSDWSTEQIRMVQSHQYSPEQVIEFSEYVIKNNHNNLDILEEMVLEFISRNLKNP